MGQRNGMLRGRIPERIDMHAVKVVRGGDAPTSAVDLAVVGCALPAPSHGSTSGRQQVALVAEVVV